MLDRKAVTRLQTAVTRLQTVIIIAVIIVAAVAGGLSYYFVTKPPTTTKTSIVVGWVHSISGVLAPQTAMFDVYYKQIISTYNAQGGLYDPDVGKNLTLTYIEYDDQSDISNCYALTLKLITVDKVDLMFPPVSTAFNYAVFPIYQEYQMPIIATTFGSDIAANEMASGQLSYCFSVLGLPSQCGEQVVQILQYINTTVDPGQCNSVAVINDNGQHGVEYGGAIDAALSLAGFTIPYTATYPSTIADFTPTIEALKAANPDVVVNCGYEGALFTRQCIEEDYNPKLIFNGPSMECPGLVYNPAIYDFTNSDLIGLMQYDGWPSTAYNTPSLAAWAAYQAQSNVTGMWPFPAAAVFYAALQVLFDAVSMVGLNHVKLRDALATDTFTTIVGQTKLVQGSSMQCSLANGTICQWQGQELMQVVWPLSAASAPIIYPKPAWPS
jgi:branched-chain amino acid transport system substrate-binding protein